MSQADLSGDPQAGPRSKSQSGSTGLARWPALSPRPRARPALPFALRGGWRLAPCPCTPRGARSGLGVGV